MTLLATSQDPHVPVSWGELIDKVTILEIKRERLVDASKCANVNKELARLVEIAAPMLDDPELAEAVATLRSVNRSLWELEDRIRLKDLAGEFDQEFVDLARSIWRTNDRRAAAKRNINLSLKSALIEEKSYAQPPAGGVHASARSPSRT